jgi:phage gpG-like protein
MASDIHFRVDVDDKQAIAFFEYAGYKTRDAREPLRKVAMEVIYPGIVEQFEEEGARTGGWQPLNKKYLKQKAKDGYGDKPILERTGEMKDALLDPEAFHVYKTKLTYRPNAPDRAVWHQQGRDDENYMPARPWLVITEEDNAQIRDIFTDWLDELRTSNPRRGGTEVYMGPIPRGWTLI